MKKPSKNIIQQAIKGSGGVLTHIANRLKVARSTAKLWLEADNDLHEAFLQEKDMAVDLAEMGLIDHLIKKEPWAIKFMLSTKGRDRGYAEKKEFNIEFNPITQIEIEENYAEWQEVKIDDNKRLPS